MKIQAWKLNRRLVLIPAVTVSLLSTFGFAQNSTLSGSYGFGGAVAQLDSNGDVGGALLGVMNIDVTGSVTGTLIVKPRNTDVQQARPVSLPFTGTYSPNPDGTGRLTIVSDLGDDFSGANLVVTDGGQGFFFLGGGSASLDTTLRGQGSSISGDLPIGMVLPGAKGAVSLKLSGGTAAGMTVYTAPATNGSGTGLCSDGSTGTWTESVVGMTIVINPTSIPGAWSGNYFFGANGALCGSGPFATRTGLVTGSIDSAGAVSLVLHDASADAINAIGRVMKGGDLNGSYAVQIKYEPFPAGTVGTMKFDGAGNVSASLTSVASGASGPATATLSGTYSLNPDGSGSITLKDASDRPGPAFAFALTDGGSQLLLLRTDNNAGFDVGFGTARLQ